MKEFKYQKTKRFEITNDTEGGDKKCILSVDFGSTNFKWKLLTEKFKVLYTNEFAISEYELENHDIDADKLWNKFVKSLDALSSFPNVDAFALSTHRNSFLIWDTESGNALTPINSYRKNISTQILEKLNNDIQIKVFKRFNKIKYFFLRKNMDKIKSGFEFKNIHVTTRLYHFFDSNKDVVEKLAQKTAKFGTIDTWFIWKLTKGKTFVTVCSHASSTGLYNVYDKKYEKSLLKFLNIPLNILPEVNDVNLGNVSADLLGYEFPIVSSLSDQAASLFGVGANSLNMCKITMGTGLFIDICTDSKPLLILEDNCYPLASWYMDNKYYYMFETNVVSLSKDVDTLMQKCNITSYSDLDLLSVKLIEDMANNVEIENSNRIIIEYLEKLVFDIYHVYSKLLSKAEIKLDAIRVEGMGSKCTFVVQYLSNLTRCQIRRFSPHSSVFGVAFIAALRSNYTTQAEINNFLFNDTNDIILPQKPEICAFCRKKYEMFYKL